MKYMSILAILGLVALLMVLPFAGVSAEKADKGSECTVEPCPSDRDITPTPAPAPAAPTFTVLMKWRITELASPETAAQYVEQGSLPWSEYSLRLRFEGWGTHYVDPPVIPASSSLTGCSSHIADVCGYYVFAIPESEEWPGQYNFQYDTINYRQALAAGEAEGTFMHNGVAYKVARLPYISTMFSGKFRFLWPDDQRVAGAPSQFRSYMKWRTTALGSPETAASVVEAGTLPWVQQDIVAYRDGRKGTGYSDTPVVPTTSDLTGCARDPAIICGYYIYAVPLSEGWPMFYTFQYDNINYGQMLGSQQLSGTIAIEGVEYIVSRLPYITVLTDTRFQFVWPGP